MRAIGSWWLAVAVVVSGCATDGGGASAGSGFPRPEVVAALARRAAPGSVFAEAVAEEAAWTLRGAPARPPSSRERAPQGPWEAPIAAAASRRGAVAFTDSMACLAEQAGRYVLDRDARPGDLLLGFLAARCGVTDPAPSLAWVVQPLRGGEGDAEILERVRPEAERVFEDALAGARTAGVWYGRGGQRAAVMLVHANPRARLEALPVAPGPDGRVVLRGELLVAADRIEALVNRGRYGVRGCTVDPSVRLPRFAVACETDAADESEALELAAFPQGRVLGPVVVRARIWPRGTPSDTFRPPALDAPAAPAAGELPAAVVALLNLVRERAGLASLDLAPAQADTAAVLAPHYFAAQGRHDAAELDAIALGVMAGWQVPGMVRRGHFASISATSVGGESPGAAALLAAALERPSCREALLEPGVRSAALGVVREGSTVGAIFGTYVPFPPGTREAEAALVVRRLDEARARHGLGRSSPLAAAAADVSAIAAEVERGERDLDRALKPLLERAGRAIDGGTAHAWVGFAAELDGLDLPESLAAAPALEVAVGVAHCKPAASPWAGYCVLVAAGQRKASVARGDSPPGAG